MASNAPNAPSVTDEVEEARRQHEALMGAAQRRKRAVGTDISAGESAPPDLRRCFVAPAHPRGKFLVRGGEVLMQPSPNGPWPYDRRGDIKIQFREGVIVLDPDDPEDAIRLAWLEDHPEIARDVDDPQTALWAKLVEDKHPTSRREASLPSNINVEEVLEGNLASMGESDLIARARSARG